MLEDASRFTMEADINGEDCRVDPEAEEALIYCAECGQQNVVSVEIDGDVVTHMGFVCEHCGAYNAP